MVNLSIPIPNLPWVVTHIHISILQSTLMLADSERNMVNLSIPIPNLPWVVTHIHISILQSTLMLAESERNMVNLSIPIPQPPVGGNPYSNAVQKFSSTI